MNKKCRHPLFNIFFFNISTPHHAVIDNNFDAFNRIFIKGELFFVFYWTRVQQPAAVELHKCSRRTAYTRFGLERHSSVKMCRQGKEKTLKIKTRYNHKNNMF